MPVSSAEKRLEEKAKKQCTKRKAKKQRTKRKAKKQCAKCAPVAILSTIVIRRIETSFLTLDDGCESCALEAADDRTAEDADGGLDVSGSGSS